MRLAYSLITLTVLSFSSITQADVIASTLSSDILPVARSSTSAFDILKPLIEARSYYDNGQYAESYKSYSAVFLHDPDSVDVLFGLANSALRSGKPEIAEKAFTRLASYTLTPKQSSTQFAGLALAEIAAGSSENPETRLRQALKIAPKNYFLWNALGQELDAQSRWQESWKAYQRASKEGFSEAGLHNNLGMSFLAQKKYQGAASHFKYAVKLSPQDKKFENNYRFSLLMLGDYSAALKNIKEDQAAILLGDAGYVALQRKEYILARAFLEKAMDVSPRYNQRAASNLEKLEALQN